VKFRKDVPLTKFVPGYAGSLEHRIMSVLGWLSDYDPKVIAHELSAMVRLAEALPDGAAAELVGKWRTAALGLVRALGTKC
jgi:hypothetical protein